MNPVKAVKREIENKQRKGVKERGQRTEKEREEGGRGKGRETACVFFHISKRPQ